MTDRTQRLILIVVAPLLVLAGVFTLLTPVPPKRPLDSIPPDLLASVVKHWDGRSSMERWMDRISPSGQTAPCPAHSGPRDPTVPGFCSG